MKKFFVYELKKSLFVMCALAVIMAAIYVITVMTYAEMLLNGYTKFPLEAIILSGGVISVIVPVWKLSYRMKKRSVDLYYALPLSHARILAVKFSVGLIAVFAPYTVAYWIGSFTAMGVVGTVLDNALFVPLFFATILPMAIIYMLSSFLFTRANRFVDGIAFIALTSMSLMIVLEVISQFVGKGVVNTGYGYNAPNGYIDSGFFAPYGALSLVGSYYSEEIFSSVSMVYRFDAQAVVGLVLIAVLAAAACVGLFVAEKRVKAENCEQISHSLFGYKTMIPLYGFALAFIAALEYYVLVALAAAAVYAVSVLYKRTPKIGWKFAVVVVVAFIIGVALSFAAK